LSPDGNRIVSGGADGTLQVWDSQGKPIAQPLKRHQGAVFSVSFNPDGKFIASGGKDGIVLLWNSEGKPIGQPWKGHQRSVNSVAFSPDGKQIVSGSKDGTVRLWDSQGNPMGQPLREYQREVTSVAFSPDGILIVSGGIGGTVQLWRGGTWQSWLDVACDKLFGHPVLVEPETILTEPDTIKVAKAARSTCQNLVWNKTENARFLVNQSLAVGRGGDVKGAMDKFQEARKLSPSIDVPTEAEVGWWAAGGLVEKGEKLVKEGKVKEALAAYREAQRLKPTWQLYADSWNTLCRFGSLHGQAAEVMKACENAVTLAPRNGEFRDSRGIARALTGNAAGAIEDFQAYINWNGSDKDGKARRKGWLDNLRAGKNPFTPEEIEKLLKE
jgi:hypothetical protein